MYSIVKRILFYTLIICNVVAAADIVGVFDETMLLRISPNGHQDTLFAVGGVLEKFRIDTASRKAYFTLTDEKSTKGPLLYEYNFALKKSTVLMKTPLIDYAFNKEGNLILCYQNGDTVYISDKQRKKIYKTFRSGNMVSQLSLSGNSLMFFEGAEGDNKSLYINNIKSGRERIVKDNNFSTFEQIDSGRFISYFGNEAWPERIAFSLTRSDSFFIGMDVVKDRIIPWGSHILLENKNRPTFFLVGLKEDVPQLADPNQYIENLSPPYNRCIFRIDVKDRTKKRLICGDIERLCDKDGEKILFISNCTEKKEPEIFNLGVYDCTKSSVNVLVKCTHVNTLNEIRFVNF